MDGPGDYLNKGRKSDKERQISYDIAYMQNPEKLYKWTHLQNKDWQTWRRNLQLPERKGRKRDKLWVWDWHVHTAIFITGNQQGPTV